METVLLEKLNIHQNFCRFFIFLIKWAKKYPLCKIWLVPTLRVNKINDLLTAATNLSSSSKKIPFFAHLRHFNESTGIHLGREWSFSLGRRWRPIFTWFVAITSTFSWSSCRDGSTRDSKSGKKYHTGINILLLIKGANTCRLHVRYIFPSSTLNTACHPSGNKSNKTYFIWKKMFSHPSGQRRAAASRPQPSLKVRAHFRITRTTILIARARD